VTALGAIGIVVGTANVAPHHGNREPWFAIGIGLAVLGVLALWWSVTLYVAHRYAESLPLQETAPAERASDGDKRIVLNEYRRRGAELDAAPSDEALAREWSDTVVKFLSEGGWPFADVARFQNAGTGTAANRLRPRADALGALIARLGSGAIADESGSESTEDGQIGMKLDTVDPTDSEGE
jgi:hypothetical protein